jgi:uncharacterized protein
MKFLADHTLGKLARELRMLGYDTVYFRGEDRHLLFHIARDEGRVILTRNTKLVAKRPEDKIIFVQEDKPFLQLKELIRNQWVSPSNDTLFSRCLLCNTTLERTEPREVEGSVPEFVFHQQEDFFRCPECHRIYWPGSHHENMKKTITELMVNPKSQVPNDK